jgi:uncharacterized short protein YbdD (DUF466 family)
MKQTLIISISLIFLSCGAVSDRDKNFINTNIALHNATFGLNHKLDSLDGKTKYVDTMAKIDIGYYPPADPDLTYEKFIEYCQKEKVDPVMFSKLLIEKK